MSIKPHDQFLRRRTGGEVWTIQSSRTPPGPLELKIVPGVKTFRGPGPLMTGFTGVPRKVDVLSDEEFV